MKYLAAFVILAFFLTSQATSAYASVITTGNVTPNNAAYWNSSTFPRIGYIPGNDVNSGTGSVTVTDGDEILFTGAYLGYDAGSSGIVTISGEGSTWTSSSTNACFMVGYQGNGTLNITNGGAVSSAYSYIGHSPNSSGEVSVDGESSTWTSSFALKVGYQGNGTLKITNGGAVVCNTDGTIGSSGEVTVDGKDSTWTNSRRLYANGMLSITNGGAVSSAVSYIAHYSSSSGEVTVDGEGSTWINSGGIQSLIVGNRGNGKLNITNGGTVISTNGHIGYEPNSSGEVSVDGEGSAWINSNHLFIGSNSNGISNGILNIINDGIVSVAKTTFVARATDSTSGSINFGSTNGGTLITQSIIVLPSHLSGTGVINTKSIISDYDLVFDSPQSLTKTFTINGSDNGAITVNLDMSNSDIEVSSFGVNQGSVTIQNGVSISSSNGEIGYFSNSSGRVTVDGEGSTWTNQFSLNVGQQGNGTLNINNGGTVSNAHGSMGYYPNSSGKVSVDGESSTWTNRFGLYVGNRGNGALNITNGGAVSNTFGYIAHFSNTSGEVTVDGEGSTWTNSSDLDVGYCGSGTLDIRSHALVSVAGSLAIDHDEDGDSFINMSDGGMLALFGEVDDSLTAFFDLINGTDAIQWWDPEAGDWNSLTTATIEEDYVLEYQTSGKLEGYTLLTVLAPANAVPEPSTVASLLMLFVAVALSMKKSR